MGFISIFKDAIRKTKEDYKQRKLINDNLSNDNTYTKKQESNNHEEESIALTQNDNKSEINIRKPYVLPQVDKVLNDKLENAKIEEITKNNIINLQNVLNDYGFIGKVVNYHIGPFAIIYDTAFKNGTKVSSLSSLTTELAIGLGVSKVEIQQPKDGNKTVGIIVYNKDVNLVPIRDVLETNIYKMVKMKLPIGLGKDISGNDVIIDLSTIPHLLISGQTGSGKTMFIHSLLVSLLMCKNPDELRLLLIDPKRVEYNEYNGIPHLYCPVVTDLRKAIIVLKSMVKKMEERYKMLENSGTRNIADYNKIASVTNNKFMTIMPYILIVIDELSELMNVDKDNVQNSILSLTEKGRLVGIHLVIATQRPSSEVLTGIIKANIHDRIAFTVSSKIDSRTIIDDIGAEELLGRGDMIYRTVGKNNKIRVQSCFVTDEEIDNVIKYVSSQQKPQYELYNSNDPKKYVVSDDPLYNEMLDYAVRAGSISASKLQRQFGVGFNRASKIIDEFEADGIVGPQKGSKPREVLIKMEGVTHDNEE